MYLRSDIWWAACSEQNLTRWQTAKRLSVVTLLCKTATRCLATNASLDRRRGRRRARTSHAKRDTAGASLPPPGPGVDDGQPTFRNSCGSDHLTLGLNAVAGNKRRKRSCKHASDIYSGREWRPLVDGKIGLPCYGSHRNRLPGQSEVCYRRSTWWPRRQMIIMW